MSIDEICSRCLPYTLHMVYSDQYNLVNAYNLCLLSILSYDNVHIEQEADKPKKPGNDTFAYWLNTLKRIPHYQGHAPLVKQVNSKEDAYTAIDGYDLKDGSQPHQDITSSECGFAVDSEAAYIFVRGTQEVMLDGAIDADAKMVPLTEGHGLVHRGFYQQFVKIINSKQFSDFYDKYASKKKHIYVTGHSLGGAVATLITAYLVSRYGKKPLLYTFGSPRVANDEFCRFYDGKFTHFRHVNDDDLVPMVPARWMEEGIQLIDYENNALVVDEGDAAKIAAQRAANPGVSVVVIVSALGVKAYRVINAEGSAYMHHGVLMQFEHFNHDQSVLTNVTSSSLALKKIEKLRRLHPGKNFHEHARSLPDNADKSISLASGANHASGQYLEKLKAELSAVYQLYEQNGCFAKTLKACGDVSYVLRYHQAIMYLDQLQAQAKARYDDGIQRIGRIRLFPKLGIGGRLLANSYDKEMAKIRADLEELNHIYEKIPRVNAKYIAGVIRLSDHLKSQLSRL